MFIYLFIKIMLFNSFFFFNINEITASQHFNRSLIILLKALSFRCFNNPTQDEVCRYQLGHEHSNDKSSCLIHHLLLTLILTEVIGIFCY